MEFNFTKNSHHRNQEIAPDIFHAEKKQLIKKTYEKQHKNILKLVGETCQNLSFVQKLKVYTDLYLKRNEEKIMILLNF